MAKQIAEGLHRSKFRGNEMIVFGDPEGFKLQFGPAKARLVVAAIRSAGLDAVLSHLAEVASSGQEDEDPEAEQKKRDELKAELSAALKE